ncbi:McrB family protein [Shewanella halifaxensis]|uniref:McrB family protein n=1 Tax=Shewanella halifaxensis TaxID=271098 RepID=UPI001F02586C|nr:AAA family ATPase [Shewanella halifaxensis]
MVYYLINTHTITNTQENEAAILQVLKIQLPVLIESGLTGKSRWPTDFAEEQVNDGEDELLGLANNTPLNRILYGPPGTGKTYHTVQMAVNAAEPSFSPNAGSRDDIRQDYKTRYDELVKAGRIRFVTFHQSYGYEEFVEGLSAKTEDGQLSYFEKDGVFKVICDEAKSNLLDSQKPAKELNKEFKFNEALENFKLTIFEDSDTYQLTDACSIIAIEKDGFRYGGNWQSRPIMKFDDLKQLYLNGVETRQDIKHISSVSGLAKQHASYFIRALEAIKQHMRSHVMSQVIIQKQNYVLIIDEINRGNISKVFGELITLIEPSKRLGQSEGLTVTLPYSGDSFSVPDNLYIIGTMNTADRSLALMDTALRRRFDFIEMMPDYKVLHDESGEPYCIEVGEFEVNLPKLLKTLNSRITALYDREHVLGHAFFIPVIDKLKDNDHRGALTELDHCFKNKILPLLAEYFFEDWQKIHLVLGDNQKPESAQLIKKQNIDIASLFGDSEELDVIDDETIDYQLIDVDSPLWLQPQTYIGISHPQSLKE